MAKPQAPRKGLTGCHFIGTCLPLHCLGGPPAIRRTTDGGQKHAFAGITSVGEISTMVRDTPGALRCISRQRRLTSYPFHRTVFQREHLVQYNTALYGARARPLCRGWVETVASASPEPTWSSSVDSIATSSNRGRTRLDHHGGRPSSPVPAQVSTKLPIPNLWGLPNLYHTLPLFCVLRLCMAGMEIRGQARKPASPQRPLCFVLWYIGSRRGQRNERHDPKAAAARDCSRLSSPPCLVLAPARADVERLSVL